ncbi:conserved hypothetical protein [Beijerinckia indica subsp. indica ATCC 9039]|uniref:Oxidoreductase probably involved in sulfite reduction n=2 Tax=Beijerinckia TaxID=532 RepID=B2IH95_BEII9|nr:conserved hypothetical protein [Beijerinckia indica subsp. indica ATCC 9039]
MLLFKNNALQADEWQKIADDESLPTSGKVLLSEARWQAEKDHLPASLTPGIKIEPKASVKELLLDLPRLILISVDFPKFTDGRGYSMARELRSYYGYQGELRATGEIFYDQLQLLARCGFDAFEITDPATLKLLEAGKRPDLGTFYQPALGTETAVGTRPWARRARAS